MFRVVISPLHLALGRVHQDENHQDENHQDAQGLEYVMCEEKLRGGSKVRGDIIVLQLLSGKILGGKT